MGIYLIYQFFIHGNYIRRKEIEYCLKVNSENKAFDKIYLLNEKIYTDEELGEGVNLDSITQIDIGSRLKFSDVFKFSLEKLKEDDVVVFGNSDIFYDESILKATDVLDSKIAHCLLRYEFKLGSPLNECKLFSNGASVPCVYSQDVWIFGNKYNSEAIQDASDFEFGRGACDRKIAYEMDNVGFKCINDCSNIKVYHYHTSQVRNWGYHLPPPYLHLSPE